MTDITMPKLSDSMEEGTLLTWLKTDGGQVSVGDELAEIETDKATMTYESPADGVLSIVAEEGETYPVGALIARLGAGQATEPAALPEQPHTEPPAVPEPPAIAEGASVPTVADGAAVKATPLARRIARDHGIALADVRGTGPNGRIQRADVAALAGIEPPAPAVLGPPADRNDASSTSTSAPPSFADGPVGAKGAPEIQEPSKVQQVIARRMAEAKATIPHFQVQTDANMGAALEMRQALKVRSADGSAPSVNDLIVKASALALRRHPRANGSYKDGRFELYPRVNVGIAVAADDALVVPTITDADSRSLGSIAAEARRLAARVRDGHITPPELSGATFTISNLGMYGMTAIIPVVNSPQAAILGVGTTRSVPVLHEDQLIERQLMTLTLSCDHRILYGADAARFLSMIRELLEQPLALIL
jgi:pyruvate dehydrogenase E2 component (dihydrolipoamide acetyltransferase)